MNETFFPPILLNKQIKNKFNKNSITSKPCKIKPLFNFHNNFGVLDASDSGSSMRLEIRTLNRDDCLMILQKINLNNVFPVKNFPKLFLLELFYL